MKQRYTNAIRSAGVVLLLCVCHLSAMAQNYGNEWIIFGNTYYKFGVAEQRIYRITKASLDNLGMSSVPGSQMALFREGQEIPIYVSTNGIFGSNDFIEFYADRADGKMDTQLYPDAAAQPSDQTPMISDTAFYFLTYNTNMHQRIESVNNSIPTPQPAAEPYFWFESRAATNPRALLGGKDISGSDASDIYFYSGQYDIGEGYVYLIRSNNAADYTINRTSRNVYTGNSSLSAQMNVSLVGASEDYTHHTYITVGSTPVFDTTYDKFDVVKKTISVPLSSLGATSTPIKFSESARYGVAFLSLKYPRTFNFSGFTNYRTLCQLPASGGNPFLSFTNFPTNGSAPILIDLTNKKRYTGTLNSNNNPVFYLNPSAGMREIFISPESEIQTIETFSQVSFRNYAQTNNQGDYIILSHKDFINASPNYIGDYRQYRQSMDGGSHNVVVVDVTELYNQFGYGYTMHPSGVKRFIQYALDQWSSKPEFLFIIGKGLQYPRYLPYTQDPGSYEFTSALVPTYGHPGSDNLFADTDGDDVPEMAVGRLSAWNNEEIGQYLTKVKDYEHALNAANTDLENAIWKKSGLHIAGGTDAALQQGTFLPNLNACKATYEDTLIGGNIITVAKNTTDPMATIEDARIDSTINSGVNIITFYGHASSTGFDYNLNDPNVYHPNPHFPIFFAFGCDVSQIFLTNRTIGENYLSSVNGGAVAMLASDNYSYTSQLNEYMRTLYKKFSFQEYGKTIGEQIRATLAATNASAMMRVHKQCILLQGDPALQIYNPGKSDYYTNDDLLSASPTPVTTALDSFNLQAVVYNLGKSTSDSVLVTLEKTKTGDQTLLYTDSLRIPVQFSDTLHFRVPINRQTDVGLCIYTVKINPDNRYEETSYQNNKAVLQLFIADNGLVPVYPHEFAIVHQQGITLKSSALNLFGPEVNYKIEIDTTALFNSPLKQSTTITSKGGVIKWKPNLTYQNNTVYYWRTASDQLVNGEIQWRNSSFIYLADGSDGWNQSHYYQYKRDEPFFGLQLPESTRKFTFGPFINNLHVKNRVLYEQYRDYVNISQTLNDVLLDDVGCVDKGAIQIVVFDSLTGQPWKNPVNGVAGSAAQCGNHNKYQFEFSCETPESRNNARLFIDSVPDNNYILIKNYTYCGPPNLWARQTITEWQADAAIYGTGNTLYDKIIELGFNQIDQFTDNKTFIFFRKKGNASYPIHQVVSQDSLDIITLDVTFASYPDTGRLTSTIIGPAKKWNSLKWQPLSYDNIPQNDHPFVNIYGINNQQEESLLYTGKAQDTALSFISANQYPNLRLVWSSVDSVNHSSAHLNYWRVLYDPVPEAALNPLAHYQFNGDSLTQGQGTNLQIAIENLTPYPMDSMLVKYRLIDANNVQHALQQKRYRKLPGNDTLIASISFNPMQYAGNNTLFIEANPDDDQPEQFHPNNLGYVPFHVDKDLTNPVLDVTFDGVHILDKDIVSAKPFIKVLMLDDNKFAALKDTALLSLKLAYPPDLSRVDSIPFDGTICKFIPADVSKDKKNQAMIEFKPVLAEDGLYKLTVSGKDVAGNEAGSAPVYEINFTVENKSTITNLLNYPNPFSTSTAFLFTLTGSQIPSQFKIQIMTVTGKIVREITKDELGPLHIGRNITEYKWDGRDQYGQLLGNGVYLYRLVTSIDGKEIEHRANQTVDKYFKHNFGKMYIMR